MFKETIIQFQIIFSLSFFDTQALYVAFYRFVIYDVSYLTVETTTKRAFEAVLEWSRWVSDISFLQGLSFVCYVKHGETKPTYLNLSSLKCFPTLKSVGLLVHWHRGEKTPKTNVDHSPKTIALYRTLWLLPNRKCSCMYINTPTHIAHIKMTSVSMTSPCE